MSVTNDAPPATATPREVAEVLRISEQALAQLRFRGVGPAYIKAPGGRRVLYLWDDVYGWMADNRRVQTGDAGNRVKAPPPNPRRARTDKQSGTLRD